MPYRRSPSVQARLDAQEATLVRAATHVLAAQGYQGLTIATVAADAGVATGTVYKHFASKAELVSAVFRDVVSREVEAVAAAARGTGSAIEQVSAAVETFAGRAMKNPVLAYALLAEPVDSAVDAERLVFRKAFAETFADAIAAGVAAGTLPPQNPRLTAAALVGAVAEVLIGPLQALPETELVLPELVAFSLRALGVSRADA